MIGDLFPRALNVAWNRLGDIGQHWELMSFVRLQQNTWDEFLENQRWYCKNIQRKEFSNEKDFLEMSKKDYAEYLESLTIWHSLCKVGEVVNVYKQPEPYMILLARSGSDTEDRSRNGSRTTKIQVMAKMSPPDPEAMQIRICLVEEKTVLRTHHHYRCIVYHASRFMSLSRTRPGPYDVDHEVSFPQMENNPVSISVRDGTISIQDATFRMLK